MMNLRDKLLVVLASSSVIFFQVQATLAQRVDIQNTTREFTVNISNTDITEGEVTEGTGVIVAREGNTYYILTASHVLNALNVNGDVQYVAITNKGRPLPLTIKERHDQKDRVDIAELSFTSDENYTPVIIGNPMTLNEGSLIYVAGWRTSGRKRDMKFTVGKLQTITINTSKGEPGQFLIYDNQVDKGLSGGPVLNQEGQLVGIHTKWATEQRVSGQGISITTIREVVVVPEIKTALGRTPSAPNIANQPPSSPNQPPASANQPPVVVRQPPPNPNQPPVVVSLPPTNEPVQVFSIVIRGLW